MKTLVAVALLLMGWCIDATAAPRPSNILVILLDDMGWRDVGFMGNKFVETPHVDRLARTGLVFTQERARRNRATRRGGRGPTPPAAD